jgi:hypothetical protein
MTGAFQMLRDERRGPTWRRSSRSLASARGSRNGCRSANRLGSRRRVPTGFRSRAARAALDRRPRLARRSRGFSLSLGRSLVWNRGRNRARRDCRRPNRRRRAARISALRRQGLRSPSHGELKHSDPSVPRRRLKLGPVRRHKPGRRPKPGLRRRGATGQARTTPAVAPLLRADAVKAGVTPNVKRTSNLTLRRFDQ